MQSFELKFLGVTISQGVEFPIFLLIFEWALQQCSATALPVIHYDIVFILFIDSRVHYLIISRIQRPLGLHPFSPCDVMFKVNNNTL